MVFEAGAVVREFETATGARLNRSHESLVIRLASIFVPRLRGLPDVDFFNAKRKDAARFGGVFSVCVWDRDEPDNGVNDEGLHEVELTQGRMAGRLVRFARAGRANVEVTFAPRPGVSRDDAQAAWARLTAFLSQLGQGDGNRS